MLTHAYGFSFSDFVNIYTIGLLCLLNLKHVTIGVVFNAFNREIV